jgi:Crp-like helix-turn-helix domain
MGRCPLSSAQDEERVVLILLELGENFGVSDGEGVRLTVPARHHDLGELVGASRPRVTEYLSSFKRKRLIVRAGRQVIIRRDQMESFLAQRHSPASCELEDVLASYPCLMSRVQSTEDILSAARAQYVIRYFRDCLDRNR